MYIPEQFAETKRQAAHDLIRAYPLATLVTRSCDGMNANHIPLYLSHAQGHALILQGHVARANPVCNDLQNGEEVLAIFQAPNAYITSSWYPTKKVNGRVVPTWNYAVIHVYGLVTIVDDRAWLREHLDNLTRHNEAGFATPWVVSDAPADFIEKLTAAIVGFELHSSRLQGKWKVSQNQPAQNREGVIRGLQARNQPMAELVAHYAKSADDA